jgi:aldose 1-epimerase
MIVEAAPGVSLHGGPSLQSQLPSVPQGFLLPQKGPFDRLVWSQLSSEQTLFFKDDSAEAAYDNSTAIFGVVSTGVSDGEQGYPGTIRVEVRMAIEPAKGVLQPAPPCRDGHQAVRLPDLGRSAGCFNMEYRAEIVEGDACTATPLSLTHHWGFNLSASDHKTHAHEHGMIDDHTLRIFPPPMQDSVSGALSEISPYRLQTPVLDHRAVPTGKLLESKPGDEHDLLHPGKDGYGRPLMHENGMADCYDNFYAWGAPEITPDQSFSNCMTRPPVFQMPRVVLRSPSTKLSLAFRSNQSGVQVYAATLQPDAPVEADITGAKKRRHAFNSDDEHHGISKRSYVALEFGHPHATFLHKPYQKLAGHDTILRKGQQYRNWVEIELHKD